MNTKFPAACFAACLLASQSVVADSAKLYWRGHYYQRFDTTVVSWAQAKAACSGKGAHLVTITSAEENDFIYGPVGVALGEDKGYYIGATDEVTAGSWKWVTGEPWDFDYLEYKGNGGDNYAYIDSSNSKWRAYDGGYLGYICEWDGKAVVAIITINDINGNGVRENAILYRADKNNAHTVLVRDPKTHKQLSTSPFKLL